MYFSYSDSTIDRLLRVDNRLIIPKTQFVVIEYCFDRQRCQTDDQIAHKPGPIHIGVEKLRAATASAHIRRGQKREATIDRVVFAEELVSLLFPIHIHHRVR
jgi:hypothetical protein